eukprot:m.169055 g.169055  ORF g.169055 m.169055 type:complete len:232 (+) comp13045_c0_seq1:158-853(+)
MQRVVAGSAARLVRCVSASTFGIEVRCPIIRAASGGHGEGAKAVGGAAGPLPETDPYFTVLWNRDSPVVEAERLQDAPPSRRRRMLMRQYNDIVSGLRVRFANEVREQAEREAAAVEDIRSEIEARKAERQRLKEEERQAKIAWQEKLADEARRQQKKVEKERRRHFKSMRAEIEAESGMVYLREKARSLEFVPLDDGDALDDVIESRIAEEADFNAVPSTRSTESSRRRG